MKAIINYLEQLDFSKIEIKIYLRLLASGPITITELAEKVKMNRTSIYNHVQSLTNKGIITKVKGETNKIEANPPDHLQYLVEQKVGVAKILQDSLPNVINTLNSSFPQSKSDHKSEMKYYKGRTGVKTIYSEALKANEIRAYYNPIDIEKNFPENYQLFYSAFTTNPKLKIYEICESSPQARAQIDRHKNHTKHVWKLLPSDIKLTANDILIYDGKVAIINIGDNHNISGVVIQNDDYFNNSKQLFNLLWRLLHETRKN